MTDSSATQTPNKKSVLSITIKDKAVLYAVYMPFLQQGGLFIPTKKPLEMGDEIHLSIDLCGAPERFDVSGHVVWKTPDGSQGNKAGGIGMQFDGPQGEKLKHKIEAILGGALESDKPTHTM